MKHLFSPTRIVFAIATVLSLTGCELYFGGNDGDGGDRWTYCANDGYYVCSGDDCEWAGPRCPDDPNYTCETNADCAAGCYCQDGVCEEAGFCGEDGQCPDGFHCDEERSSCVPDGCNTSADCEAGEYCDPGTKTCTSSCTCDSDAAAQSQGWGYCDETRGTCEPPNPAGSCGGAVTCNQIMTACPDGQVALISNGCWTGTCGAIASCDVTPGCTSLQHEGDCLGRTADCTSIYQGINCTNPTTGQSCTAGATGCTCESFQFARCSMRTSSAPAMSFLNDEGRLVDVFAN
ncbi:MAG: hypothetical protein H0T46_00640 [Deltaproteobacteria bacterium]|nr:hypothetical protein [Deltaproteobacteria bacterium]